MIPWILPPRPAGPDRHPAPALAGEAGSAASPMYFTCVAPAGSKSLQDAAALIAVEFDVTIPNLSHIHDTDGPIEEQWVHRTHLQHYLQLAISDNAPRQ